MFAEYEITRVGSKFIVTHASGLKVAEFRTLGSAKAHVAVLTRDAAMLETARVLVVQAVETVMKKHGVSRSIAECWVREASGLPQAARDVCESEHHRNRAEF
jgi:hypothetical protein